MGGVQRKELFRLKGHNARFMSAPFFPDGRRIVTGSDDQTSKVWEASTATSFAHAPGHRAMLWSVAFSPTASGL